MSPDRATFEKLVICIRWVDKEITVCEEYIGLMPVAQTNADTIVVCINNVLLRMNFGIQDAGGQCCVRCLTMPGTRMRLLLKSRN